MATINLSGCKTRGTNYCSIWDELTGPVFRVVDEEGNNVADARVRHLLGKFWLYVDDMDGFEIFDEGSVESLILVVE